MQQSIKKYKTALKKPVEPRHDVKESLERSQRDHASEPPPKRARSSGLVRLLASQLVYESEVKRGESAALRAEKRRRASVRESRRCDLGKENIVEKEEKIRRTENAWETVESFQRNHSFTTNRDGKPLTLQVECPICGLKVEDTLFQDHMKEEMDSLDMFDNENGWMGGRAMHRKCRTGAAEPRNQGLECKGHMNQRVSQTNTQSSNSGSTNSKKEVKRRTSELKPKRNVVILGGTPAAPVPRDPKQYLRNKETYALKVGQNQTQKYWRALKDRIRSECNHYGDFGDLVDGEDLGLDENENVGIGWEGMGSTTF